MSKKINVGLVGLGGISAYFIAALSKSKSMQLVAICTKNKVTDLSPHKISSESVELFTDYDAFLKSPDLDLVLIATPNFTHFDLIKKALNHKLHVGCEKPLVTSSVEYNVLSKLAVKNNKVLFGIYHRRYNDAFYKLKAQLKGEEITAVSMRYLENIKEHSGTSTWYFNPEKSGGGCLIDNGVNCLDILMELVGDLHFVTGHLGYKQVAGMNHDANAFLEFATPTKVICTLELDWYFNGEQKDLTVYTKSGKVYYCDFISHWPGFKNSLWHEYEKALVELYNRINATNYTLDHASQLNIAIIDEVYTKISKPFDVAE